MSNSLYDQAFQVMEQGESNYFSLKHDDYKKRYPEERSDQSNNSTSQIVLQAQIDNPEEYGNYLVPLRRQWLKTIDKREKEAMEAQDDSQPEFADSPKKSFKTESSRSTDLAPTYNRQNDLTNSEQDLMKTYRNLRDESSRDNNKSDSTVNFILCILVILIFILIFLVFCLGSARVSLPFMDEPKPLHIRQPDL